MKLIFAVDAEFENIFYRFQICNFASQAINFKKVGKWMLLCYTVGYKWVTVLDDIEFEFNDVISLYTKNDSERRLYVILLYFYR